MAALCDQAELQGGGIDRPTDYRATLEPDKTVGFFSPVDETTVAALDSRFEALTLGEARAVDFPVANGRAIELRYSPRGVARLSFDQLCNSHLGAADYIALAQRCHTLCIDEVPQLSLRERDKARRFITLIDQLYNHKVRLMATSAVPLQQLFNGGGAASDGAASLEGLEFEGEAGKSEELNPIGNPANRLEVPSRNSGRVAADSRKDLYRGQDSLFTGEDESFAFRRALSRLIEMQSVRYSALRPRP